MILPVLLPLVRYSGVEKLIEFNGLMMSVLGVDRSKIHIEDLYEISILVSFYVIKSSLPLVLSVDLPDK